jgi:hypothetical protein
MATYAEIPTEGGHPFYEIIAWSDGLSYTLFFKWNVIALCWVLDIYAADGITPVINGIPIVTGADLLEQFGYLTLGAFTMLQATTIGPFVSPDSVPDFLNFGTDGHLFTVTP